MKKLKSKIFVLLVLILTLFLVTVLVIFNVSVYGNEFNSIKDKIVRVTDFHEKFDGGKNGDEARVFVDVEIYVVSFDGGGKIRSINSYDNDGLTESEIRELIDGYKGKYEVGYVSNLYLNQYIFSLSTGGDLIIINNLAGKKYLLSCLGQSMVIFLVLEGVIVYVSYLLSRWLIRPVQESFDKQKQFISDASHELKTPISIVMASAEALEGNPKEKKWLANIKSEAARMNKLVVNLLELSRVEDMEEREVYGEVNLSKLIENKALSFESLMFEDNLSLELNICPDISFRCNADRIKELLSILLDNAIKYGYDNSKIVVSLYKEHNVIYLEVKNRGDEIKKEEREKIFERFYRVDKSRNRDDDRYGLGLSIAYNIVMRHKGNIVVLCKNGYTIFRVTFKQN